jgi:hypothetical protein
MRHSLRRPLVTSLAALALAVSGLTLLAGTPAAAHTVCDAYGRCYNTSGAPIYNGPTWHPHHYWRRPWHHYENQY